MEVLIALLVGLGCGVLSGLGLGGGSLLMLWLTTGLGLGQQPAQGINLLFFLPAAFSALILHGKAGRIAWHALIPAVVLGLPGAALGSRLSAVLEPRLLRRCFGVLLILMGLGTLGGGKNNHAGGG